MILSASNLNLQHYNHVRRSKCFAKEYSLPRRMVTNKSTKCCSMLQSTNVAVLDAAAKHTVDSFIENGMVVGLGSGAASSMAIRYLGQKLRVGAIRKVIGVPTSVESAGEAEKAGIPLNHFQDGTQIDVGFSDADVIEEETLVSVIGRRKMQGEESILQEKNILTLAKNLVYIVSEKQYRSGLDGSIPIVIKSPSWLETAEEIDDLFLGDAEVWRRSSMGLAGPTGGDFPLVTREGHNVLDLIFTSPISDLGKVAKTLDIIAGVVDHGIISKIPCTAVIASEDGITIVQNPPLNVAS